jgi:hypothetical protein
MNPRYKVIVRKMIHDKMYGIEYNVEMKRYTICNVPIMQLIP